MSKWTQMKMLADKVREGDRNAAQQYVYEFRYGASIDRDVVIQALSILVLGLLDDAEMYA